MERLCRWLGEFAEGLEVSALLCYGGKMGWGGGKEVER